MTIYLRFTRYFMLQYYISVNYVSLFSRYGSYFFILIITIDWYFLFYNFYFLFFQFLVRFQFLSDHLATIIFFLLGEDCKINVRAVKETHATWAILINRDDCFLNNISNCLHHRLLFATYIKKYEVNRVNNKNSTFLSIVRTVPDERSNKVNLETTKESSWK